MKDIEIDIFLVLFLCFMLTTLTLKLHQSDAIELSRMAKEQHRSRAALLRVLVEDYLRANGVPRPGARAVAPVVAEGGAEAAV